MQHFRDINRQASKIVRILSKVAERDPELATDIDLALYAAIKIEKMTGKNLKEQVSEEGLMRVRGERGGGNDPVLEAAWTNIEHFKQSTAKLQRKINILVNESQTVQKGVYYHKSKHQQPKQGFIINATSKIRPVKSVKSRKMRLQDEDNSRSLSDIDYSILKLSNKITTIMAQERNRQPSGGQSLVEQYQH